MSAPVPVSDKICLLEAEIAKRNAEYDNSTNQTEKSELRALINARTNTLNILLNQQTASQSGLEVERLKLELQLEQERNIAGLEVERLKLELQLEQERNKGVELRAREALPRLPVYPAGARSHSTSSASSSQKKLPSISSNQSVSSKDNRSNSSPSVRQQERIVAFERLYGGKHCPPTDEQSLKYKRKLNCKLKDTEWALRFSLDEVSVVLNTDKKAPVFKVDVSGSAWEWKREYFLWKDAIIAIAGSACLDKNSAILERYKHNRTVPSDGASSTRTSNDSTSAPVSVGRASLVSLM